jgi:hypothetical protein
VVFFCRVRKTGQLPLAFACWSETMPIESCSHINDTFELQRIGDDHMVILFNILYACTRRSIMSIRPWKYARFLKKSTKKWFPKIMQKLSLPTQVPGLASKLKTFRQTLTAHYRWQFLSLPDDHTRLRRLKIKY